MVKIILMLVVFPLFGSGLTLAVEGYGGAFGLFNVENEFTKAEPTFGGGITLWPESDSESDLNPALNGGRFGWSVRFAFGGSYRFTQKLSLITQFGYFASSSYGKNIWVTHDTMLITLGGQYHF